MASRELRRSQWLAELVTLPHVRASAGFPPTPSIAIILLESDIPLSRLLGPESAQVHAQEVMQTSVRCSEYLTGLPKRGCKSIVSRNYRSLVSSLAFSESRPQGWSLPPDLRGHGRLDVSIPSFCFPFFVFSHPTRFGWLTLLHLSTAPPVRCGPQNCCFVSSPLSYTRPSRLLRLSPLAL
jgi:hypothetical protein